MHGNSKMAMAMRLVDLNKWLRDTPADSKQAEWYRGEIAKLMKRLYRQLYTARLSPVDNFLRKFSNLCQAYLDNNFVIKNFVKHC